MVSSEIGVITLETNEIVLEVAEVKKRMHVSLGICGVAQLHVEK